MNTISWKIAIPIIIIMMIIIELSVLLPIYNRNKSYKKYKMRKITKNKKVERGVINNILDLVFGYQPMMGTGLE